VVQLHPDELPVPEVAVPASPPPSSVVAGEPESSDGDTVKPESSLALVPESSDATAPESSPAAGGPESSDVRTPESVDAPESAPPLLAPELLPLLDPELPPLLDTEHVAPPHVSPAWVRLFSRLNNSQQDRSLHPPQSRLRWRQGCRDGGVFVA
jgi:hypothetical protein